MRECPREALVSITQTPRAENKAARFAGAGEVRTRSIVCRSMPSPSEEAGPWAAVTMPWLWEDPLSNLLAPIYHCPLHTFLNTIYPKFTVSEVKVSIPVPFYEDRGYLSSRWAKGNSHRLMLGIAGSFLRYASSFFDRRKCLLCTMRGPEEKGGGPNCLGQVGIGKVAISGLQI